MDAMLVAEGIPVIDGKEIEESTGYEALWVVDAPAEGVKRLCIELEKDALGCLFDLDVLGPIQGKWDRKYLSENPRTCLVRGKVGKECASRRLRTLVGLGFTASTSNYGRWANTVSRGTGRAGSGFYRT